MKFYSAVKRNEAINLTGKWAELENILCEITQSQKDKCHMSYFLL